MAVRQVTTVRRTRIRTRTWGSSRKPVGIRKSSSGGSGSGLRRRCPTCGKFM